MKFYKNSVQIYYLLFFTLSILIFVQGNDYGQNKVNVDDRFKEARELAFSGNRSASIDSCKSILKDYPHYLDVKVFMARVMAWEKNYDEAIENLHQVIDEKRDHKEAINTLIDVYYWSGNYGLALKFADYGLSFYSSYPDFLIKKAKMLEKLERPDESAKVLNQLLDIYPTHKEGLALEESLANLAILNKLTLFYRSDLFPTSAPWHLLYLEYSRKFMFGTIIGRLNYANRFNKSGVQIEGDGYINIRQGTYVYLNAGYSGVSIFPKIRLGIEPYQMLPYSFEVSLGLKYLDFNTSVARIFTGSFGKYIGNYWISYRFYLTPKSDKTSFSSAIYLRRYFSDTDNYVTLRLGLGVVSYSDFTDEQFSGVSSKGAGVEFQFSLAKLTFVRGEVNYGNHEFYKGKYRDRYGIKLGIQRRF